MPSTVYCITRSSLTRSLVLDTDAVSSDEAVGAVTAEGALLVDARLVESRARDRLISTLVHVCGGKVKKTFSLREIGEERGAESRANKAARPYRDTSPLSVCSHARIFYSGPDRCPCSPRTPGHSLQTRQEARRSASAAS